MSKWRERYKSAKEKPARGGPGAASYEELPELSEAMAGIPTSDGKGWECPPQSLTIWLEGPYAKFCLGSEGSDIKTFGTFPELSEGLQGVEKALNDGKCETKRVQSRMSR